jgi:hypothetical protein
MAKVKANVINLSERTDRWEAFCEAWKDSDLEIVRQEAIKDENVYHAVFFKHWEILLAAKERGEEHCLIMEDDAVPCADFVKRFKHIRDYLDIRDDWEIFNGGMLSIRDCVHKIVRIDDEGLTTMVLDVSRGCMAHFVYFKVDKALEKMKEWEADGRPEFDGWYSHKLICRACIPFISVQKDGHSDASKSERKWEERFKEEEMTMKYALREFMKPLATTFSPSSSSPSPEDAAENVPSSPS